MKIWRLGKLFGIRSFFSHGKGGVGHHWPAVTFTFLPLYPQGGQKRPQFGLYSSHYISYFWRTTHYIKATRQGLSKLQQLARYPATQCKGSNSFVLLRLKTERVASLEVGQRQLTHTLWAKSGKLGSSLIRENNKQTLECVTAVVSIGLIRNRKTLGKEARLTITLYPEIHFFCVQIEGSQPEGTRVISVLLSVYMYSTV